MVKIPFFARCGSCQSELTIRKLELVGKRVACPKCKSPVLIHAPVEPTPDVQPAEEWDSTVSSDPVAEDPWLDEAEAEFEDLAEENLDPAELGPRRSKSKKKKQGPQAKGKGNSRRKDSQSRTMLIAGIGGGALLLIAVVVTLMFVFRGDGKEVADKANGQGHDTSGQSAAVPNTGSLQPATDDSEMPPEAPPEVSKSAESEAVLPSSKISRSLTLQGGREGIPDFVDNIVQVHSSLHPDVLMTGYYIRQIDGKSIVAAPIPQQVLYSQNGLVDFEVEFHPGTPKSQRCSARELFEGNRGISNVRRFKFLEVIDPVSPPVEVPWLGMEDRKGRPVRIFGLQVDSNSPIDRVCHFAECKGKQANFEVEDISLPLLPGSVVCDENGRPFAILGDKDVSHLKDMVSIDHWAFEKHFLAEAGFSHPVRWAGRLEYSRFRLDIDLHDPLATSTVEKFWIGSLDHLQSVNSLKELDASKPATTDMIEFPVQRRLSHVELRTGGKSDHDQMPRRRWVVYLPPELDKEQNLILQCQIRDSSGQLRFTPPWVSLSSESAGWNDRHFLPAHDDTEYGDSRYLFAKLKERVQSDRPTLKLLSHIPRDSVRTETFVAGTPQTELGVKYTTVDILKDHANDRLLPDFAWSTDGSLVCVATLKGRIHLIQPNNPTEIKVLDLQTECTDLDMSGQGWLALSGGVLWVLGRDTLEVVKEIPLPAASLVAAAPDSSIAYVADSDKLWSVNLETGEIVPAPVDWPDHYAIPRDLIIRIEMIAGSGDLIVSDFNRIHRLKPGSNGLSPVSSTPPIGRLGTFEFESEGQEIIARLVIDINNPIPRIGLPKATSLVYSIDDLTTPLFAADDVLSDTFTGALLFSIFEYEGGTREQQISICGSHSGQVLAEGPGLRVPFGISSPAGGRFAVLRGVFALAEIPSLTGKDSLRTKLIGDPKVESIGKSIIQSDKAIDGWRVVELGLDCDPRFVGGSRKTSLVKSMAWSNQGESCYLLMADDQLHKLRLSDMVLVSSRQFRDVRQILMTSAGPVIVQPAASQLVLLDPDSLQPKSAMTWVIDGVCAATPKTSRVWQYVAAGTRGGTFKQPGMTSYDVLAKQAGQVNPLGIGKGTGFGLVTWKPYNDIALTPNGHNLIMSDRLGMMRYTIQGDSAKYVDEIGTLCQGLHRSMVVSPDFTVAGLFGVREYPSDRPTFRQKQGNYGAACLTVRNFDHIRIDFVDSAILPAYAIDAKKKLVYGASSQGQILMYNKDSQVVGKVQLPHADDSIRMDAHPRFQGILIHGAKALWVVPPSP